MQLSFRPHLAAAYKSPAQIARVLTEEWLSREVYCPNCGEHPLKAFPNNTPVADFFCANCDEEFELKSKKGNLGHHINDGSYKVMLERIQAENNPHFFFLNYGADWQVQQLLLIPKHFFTPSVIVARKPLTDTAKRAGWIGCKIDLTKLPSAGHIFVVREGKACPPEQVRENYRKTLFLGQQKVKNRGWTLSVMHCIERLNKEVFSLQELDFFVPELQAQYPKNKFIREKIRQQLQILRDQGWLEFQSRGVYRRIF